MAISAPATRRWVLLLLVTSLVGSSQAQQVPKLDLSVKEEKPLPDFASSILLTGAVLCDSRGNIYLRPAQAPRPDPAAPVAKISPEDVQKTAFSIKGVPGFERARVMIYDFAVGLRGQVYLLVGKCEGVKNPKCEVDVLSLDENGAYQSATKLERYFYPSRFAVFLSGEFLVSGTRDKEVGTAEASAAQTGSRSLPVEEPYTAIFDGSGRVRAELTLPDDVKLESAGDSEPDKEPEGARLAVEWGMVASGEDGNIYLARSMAKPLVFVISPDGSVLRRFEVKPPGENTWVCPTRIGSSPSRCCTRARSGPRCSAR